MTNEQVDIKENDIFELSPELLGTLLKDHSRSTDDYAHFGNGYQYHDPITIEAITGERGNVIVPRAQEQANNPFHRRMK